MDKVLLLRIYIHNRVLQQRKWTEIRIAQKSSAFRNSFTELTALSEICIVDINQFFPVNRHTKRVCRKRLYAIYAYVNPSTIRKCPRTTRTTIRRIADHSR